MQSSPFAQRMRKMFLHPFATAAFCFATAAFCFEAYHPILSLWSIEVLSAQNRLSGGPLPGTRAWSSVVKHPKNVSLNGDPIDRCVFLPPKTLLDLVSFKACLGWQGPHREKGSWKLFNLGLGEPFLGVGAGLLRCGEPFLGVGA